MKILFVCLGNICRSPTAHGVMEKQLTDQNIQHVQVDSAGTAAYHVGKAPDQRTQQAARSRGYDLSHLRARQVSENDFYEFDYIFAMDEENLSNLKAIQPADSTATVHLALSFTQSPLRAVPDPYYGGDEGFRQVLDLCEKLSDGIIEQLIKG